MPLPGIQPVSPASRKEPFDDPDWVFEFKYDGFRAKRGGTVARLSDRDKSGLVVTPGYAGLVAVFPPSPPALPM
jgi:hypothetical protein